MHEILSHPIAAAIILLGVLVFVHELGHFLVGIWCGIGVEIFSIGFGPKIFGFKHGHTEYLLSWIPLGGYVKFAGSSPGEEVPPAFRGKEFRNADVWKRILVALSGPLANFIFAIGAYTWLGHTGIEHPPAIIGEVLPASPAEAAGIKFGDKIVAISGNKIGSWRDLETRISKAADQEIIIVVERNGREEQIKLVPEAAEVKTIGGGTIKKGRAGIALGFIPSIVTVTESKSRAYQSGLRTGDRVISANIDGVDKPIQAYSELSQLFLDELAAGKQTLSLKVITTFPSKMAEKNTNKLAEVKPTEASLSQPSVERSINIALAGVTKNSSLKNIGISDSQLTIGDPAKLKDAGLQEGDRVVAWNNTPLNNLYDLRDVLLTAADEKVQLRVARLDKTTEFPVILDGQDVQGPTGRVRMFSIPALFWGQPVEPAPIIEKYDSAMSALTYGLAETWRQSVSLVGTVAELMTGNVPLKALGGPMLIAKVAGDSVKQGLTAFISVMAIISINLGVLNLFPIPVLDGGQIVLFLLEAIRRRPLGEAAIENFQKVGFVMVLALVIVATYNDLSRFWKSMLESVVGVFQ